jgi:hypothetical protein
VGRRAEVPFMKSDGKCQFERSMLRFGRDVDKIEKTSFGTFFREQKGIFRHLLITY